VDEEKEQVKGKYIATAARWKMFKCHETIRRHSHTYIYIYQPKLNLACFLFVSYTEEEEQVDDEKESVEEDEDYGKADGARLFFVISSSFCFCLPWISIFFNAISCSFFYTVNEEYEEVVEVR
jgi:hypothetical protein